MGETITIAGSLDAARARTMLRFVSQLRSIDGCASEPAAREGSLATSEGVCEGALAQCALSDTPPPATTAAAAASRGRAANRGKARKNISRPDFLSDHNEGNS